MKNKALITTNILMASRFVLLLAICVWTSCTPNETISSTTWIIDNTIEIGGLQPEVLGAPEVVTTDWGNALYFDGTDDGLMLPINPVEGWEEFTIEVLFRPGADGPEEQRFIHFQDSSENRGLIETRLNDNGDWSLDTYLYNESDDIGLTLLDRQINHSSDEFYWAALTYDGTTMSHFVNGEKELEGEIDFEPMGAGRISIGVRMNKIYWFKGIIREIRFHPKVISTEELQTVQN